MNKECQIKNLQCPCPEYSKEALCDYPYKEGMTLSEIKQVTRSYELTRVVSRFAELVAREYDVPENEILERHRDSLTALARQVVMYLMVMRNGYTLAEIGSVLDGRTPSTVSHGFQKVARLLENNKALKNRINAIQGLVFG